MSFSSYVRVSFFSPVFGETSSAACARQMGDNTDARPMSRTILNFIIFDLPGQEWPKRGDFKREKNG